jgi:hypothetical protein
VPPHAQYARAAPAMAAAPAAFMSAPPPGLSRTKLLPAALLAATPLVFAGAWVAARQSPLWRGKLLFAGQMALLTAALCLTPTLSYHLTKRWGRAARVVLETALFAAVFALFYVWLWGGEGLGERIRYAILLTLLIEAGGHLVEWDMAKTLARLSKSDLFVNLRPDAETLERMFRRELAIYVPVPFGLVVGTAWGLARGLSSQETVSLSLRVVLWLTSLAILYFLAVGFARMSDALFKGVELPPGQAAPKAQRRKGGKRFRLSASAKAGDGRRVLDMACMVADLRKVYLFDSAHNVVLLVAFAAVALKLQGVGVDEKTLLLLLLFLSFGFNHLPYIIGQSRLHDKVLEPYQGVERAEINAKLKEHAPFFPRWEFLAVLLTSSPAGGVVYFLLEHSVHDVLK